MEIAARSCIYSSGATTAGNLLLSWLVSSNYRSSNHAIDLRTESPRWFIKKRRYHDAYRSLKKLRNTKLQAARDLYYIHKQLTDESHSTSRSTGQCSNDQTAIFNVSQTPQGLRSYLVRLKELFLKNRVRQATIASFTVMIAQQMCGKHVKYGLVAMCLFIYTAIYSTGEGPVPFTYSAEAFPLSHREIGMGFAVATNFIFAAMLSVTFPLMLARFQPVGAMIFYAGLNVIAVIMIFLLVPETRQRTLEDLDHIFDKPVRKFARESIRESIQDLKFHRAKNCEHTLASAPKIIRRNTV
ncbi:MAG: hypothetical protein LQ347_003877 [Umbilicaria vellea]|nr:MAG: hypothetical protein LQ347_003877 [Umbilicaria vellea]